MYILLAILFYSVIRAASVLSLNDFDTFGSLAVYSIETAIDILLSKYLISIIDKAPSDASYNIFTRSRYISITTHL